MKVPLRDRISGLGNGTTSPLSSTCPRMNSPALTGAPEPGVGCIPLPSNCGSESRSRYPKCSCAWSNGGMPSRSREERTSTPGIPAKNSRCSRVTRSRSTALRAKRITMACSAGLPRPPSHLAGIFLSVSRALPHAPPCPPGILWETSRAIAHPLRAREVLAT